MNRNLKKCYDCLDLPFSATKEQVETRKTALIKILKAKENETKISNEKEIELVELSAKTICEELEKNGIPKNIKRFECSNESILILIVVLIFAFMLCFFSFNANL